MNTDIYGQFIYNEDEICDILLSDPDLTLDELLVDKEIVISDVLELNSYPNIKVYSDPNVTINEFDTIQQNIWYLPENYKNLDIAKWVLEQCKNDAELQRAGQELLMFQERNLFELLKYLKYLVDFMKENNIVYGVGRGSSVASFVLYIIGVHKINSLYYDLPIDEFLK